MHRHTYTHTPTQAHRAPHADPGGCLSLARVKACGGVWFGCQTGLPGDKEKESFELSH